MKPEWGTKHQCIGCGASFYDMRKPDACCPKCNTPANDKAALLAKVSTYEAPPPKKPTPEDILEDFDDVDVDDDLELDDDDDDFLEDADDLVDDDSDMSEIIEHIDSDEEETS
ncbi:MAG: FYDLN acid domain-containing protein [Methylocystaceae bacterium]|nr:FYDLN acid domain-containing protein [Methylocystaceae bacterium]